MSNEFDFIAWIRQQQKISPRVQLGVGDDLAVLNWGSENLLLAGVDQVLDGVHFYSKTHSPRAIGRKAMNRNLSDCAAMGCLPAAALITVALPKGVGDYYAQELFLGIQEAGEIFTCPIVGGDTSSWTGKLAVTVTILGRSEGVAPITRSGAKPGDQIYVTGPLGGSILGRHMTFSPRVEQGRRLAQSGHVTSMIDLSDGLSRDLKHLCAGSGLGAVIQSASIPIHADALQMNRDAFSPLDHALHDGEDYELLFTADRQSEGIPIGVMTAEPGIWLELNQSRIPLQPRSWEHTF